MNDINRVIIIGRLTRDSELRYTNGGLAIAKFSIAVNRRKKQGDQWVDEASFLDVSYFGKGAEAVNQYLTKGQKIAVDGELRQNRWEQDGQQRSKVEIVANGVQLVGGKRNDGPGQGNESYGNHGKPTGQQSHGFDEVPF